MSRRRLKQVRAWVETRRRLGLTHAHVQMARELGLEPKTLPDSASAAAELLERRYRERFGRERPDHVRPIDRLLRILERKDRAREQPRAQPSPERRRMAVFVAWYRREEWPELRRLASDADVLEERYDEWLENATRTLEQLRAAGLRVKPVDVDVHALGRWCEARQRPCDSASRSQYAAELGSRQGA